MKKIFKIAFYDFRRLILNPFTIVGLIVMLVGVLVLGALYKIPTSPKYITAIDGQTTKQIIYNFNASNDNSDSKANLLNLIEDAKKFVLAQKDFSTYENLKKINIQINGTDQSISTEIKKFQQGKDTIFMTDLQPIKTVSSALKDFINAFKKLKIFETNLFIQTGDLTKLEDISNFLYDTAFSAKSNVEVLTILSDQFNNFEVLNDIVLRKVLTWSVNTDNFESYIAKAQSKCANIENEIENINKLVTSSDEEYVSDVKSLLTNFKLTCESAKAGVEYELNLLLNQHFKNAKNFYGHQKFSEQELKLALTKINHFLSREEIYYTQQQSPLNFNTASYEVSVYDKTYFIISIVGFITILFGIFCAYKLFGQDRKNGKWMSSFHKMSLLDKFLRLNLLQS